LVAETHWEKKKKSFAQQIKGWILDGF